VTAKDTFNWGGASWKVLSPPRNAYLKDDEVENSSLVVLLTTNSKRFLFTGDIKQQASAALAESWTVGPVDVFFVTHHGSAAGSAEALLQKIEAEVAVLSTKSSKIFAASTAARLKNHVTDAIYCTDTNGTITATVSADGITWSTSKPGPAWWTKAGGQTGECAGR
jgi:beta-lactamase superfamily II metal-dependent hydrolase